MFTTENFTTSYRLFGSDKGYIRKDFKFQNSKIINSKKIKKYKCAVMRDRRCYERFNTVRGVWGFETFEEALEMFNKLWSEDHENAPYSIIKMNTEPQEGSPSVSFWTFTPYMLPRLVAEYDKENPLDDTNPLMTRDQGLGYGLHYTMPRSLSNTLSMLMPWVGHQPHQSSLPPGMVWVKPKTFKEAFTLAKIFE